MKGGGEEPALRRRLPGRAAAALATLAAGLLAVLPSAAGEPERCVVTPAEMAAALAAEAVTPRALAAAPQALGAGSWQDGVFVLPYGFGGSYDRELGGAPNVAPRQWVAQSFFAANPDRYDFVLVLTNFDWNAGAQTRGLYWSIANDVTGIGIDPVDLSPQFGSEHLQGYIDGMNLREYRLGDGSLDRQRVREILNHELGHRWLVHADYRDGGADSAALRGRDGSHWSYLLDSDASFLYGSDWTANGDGTYTATAVRRRFSSLDLYLMGLAGPEEVSPLTLLVNPAVDATEIPLLGATIAATAETVTIDQIVAAEGARSPAYPAAPKEFSIGVIFLYDPGQGFTSQDLALAGELKSYWRQSFFQETRGRAVVEVKPRPLPTTGGAVDLPRALAWLAGRGEGGAFSDSPVTVARDTAEAIEALGRAGGYQAKVESGLAALPNLAAEAGELRLRRLEALARWGGDAAARARLLAEALAAQEADGGFAALPRYSPDNVTSARAVRTLAAAGRGAEAGRAYAWLAARRNADGGWPWQEGGTSSVAATLEVALAARALDPGGFFARPEVAAAHAFLLGKRVDGGLGDGQPNVAQTALFLQLILDQAIDQSQVQGAVDFLSGRQQADGSWEGSVYKTALAAAALQTFLLPDPYVDPTEVLADPAKPFVDEPSVLLAAVRNGGTFLAAGAEYAWQIRRNGAAEPLLILSGTLPDLGEGGFFTVETALLPGQLPAGDYELRFVIDPDRRISEKSRDNDVAKLPFTVREHPAGVDLELRRADLQLSPDEIAAMPQAFVASGSLRNLGLTPANGVRVVAFDGDPRQGVVLGETTVDVPAVGSAVFQIDALVSGARPHEIFVVADPDNATGDADSFNNRASALMLLRLRSDLAVVPGSFAAAPAAGEVGTPRHLSLGVRNLGTTTLENFQVAFHYTGPAGTFLIRQLTVGQALPPGAETAVETDFTPQVDGLLELAATIDPQNVLGDVDRSNNAAQLSLPVGANSLTNLHLELGGIATVPSPPLQGQSAEVRVSIHNPSTNAAPAFVARLWLDQIGSGTQLAETTFPGLAAQGSVELAATWQVDAPQNRKIYAEVDPDDLIAELDEEDNQSFVVADVATWPDLALSSGAIRVTPDFPQAGDTLEIAVEILNLGDQPSQATTLELRGAGGALLAATAVPAMAGHQRATYQLSWTPPGGPGDYDLAARVNLPAAFPELEVVNNAASFSVALQDGNLYVSNQIFSPNGDGIKDTATIFFRLPASAVEIVDRDGDVLRTLPTGGAQAVLWDGRSDRSLLARDGVYRVRLVDAPEAVETWVAVDNNLTGISQDVRQRLLVGFLEPELPGGYPERSYFTSMLVNPVTDELYAVEHHQNHELGQERYTLRRFDGEEMVELGDYPPAGRELLSADGSGTRFLAGGYWDSSFDLLTYPGPVLRQLAAPEEGGYLPWISPDGRFVAWIARWGAETIFLEDLANGERHRFSSADEGLYGGCGFTVNWTRNGQLVVSLGRWNSEGFYYHIDTATEPPSGAVRIAEGSYSMCGSGSLAPLAGQPGMPAIRPRANVGWDNNNFGGSVDLEKGTLTWVIPSDGGIGLRSGAPRFELPAGMTGEDFWHAASAGFYGAEGLEVHRWRLADGGYLSGAPLDLGPVTMWGSPPMAMSNDGDALSIFLGGGGTLAEREQLSSRGFLPAAPPEVLTAAGHGELANLTPQGVVVSSDQRLVDWRHGEQRGLPFELGHALFSAADKYLVASTDVGWQNNDLLPYFSPAANLTTRLRPRILFGDAGVDLWVLATDAHLQHYRLDYADLDDPSLAWHAIGLPSDEPLFGERWGTWLPPGNGRYRVRLEALDRAGNLRSSLKRVVWNGDNDIANLYLEHRYVSPRTSPGVKDALIFHYTVLRPANLRFSIVAEGGETVAEIEVAADAVGPRSTTFGGDDGVGNPLPDGAYELKYGEASWPFVIDNTPPAVVLTIGPTRLMEQLPNGSGAIVADLLANEIFAAVREIHLEDWTYEARSASFPGWLVVDRGNAEFERDGERAWRTVGAASLVRRELRLVARDLAGNETVVARGHRDEKLRFAESEPGCRTELPPCIYPERPETDELGDNGGRLERPAHTLDPHYDTLLVQSTVWTDALELRLEHRPASLTGLPTGPWQTGEIEVRAAPAKRRVCTPDTSAKDPDSLCYEVQDGLRALYWNHPGLALSPQQVRLAATNADGQVIYSPVVDYPPAVPLFLEHLGVGEDGDRLRITNVGSTTVRSIAIALRRETADGVIWEPLFEQPATLRPGEHLQLDAGCSLLPFGERQIRAQGRDHLGQDAVSLAIVVPEREGFARLASLFVPATCSPGTAEGVVASSTAASGFGSDALWENCPQPPTPDPYPGFSAFWYGRGDSPQLVSGFVPRDPAAVPIARYELLVNGAVYLSLDGPFEPGSAGPRPQQWRQPLDFSALAEGQYILSERFVYLPGQEGMLGSCPQQLALHIDRTPPTPQIAAPAHGAFVCPADLQLPVDLAGSDASPVRETVLLGGGVRTGSPACPPYAEIGGEYRIPANAIEPGEHWIGSRVVDLAGNASCTQVEVSVPQLPLVSLAVAPRLFSPVNTLGRPTAAEASFKTRAAGSWEGEIAGPAGTPVVLLAPTATDGITPVELAWDGRDGSGALQADGFYQLRIAATSMCGARHQARVAVELDATPPQAILSAPAAGAVIGAVAEFRGLARDLHFESYRLEVLGLEAGPTDWTTVASGSRPTELTDAPLGLWRTDGYPAGNYLVRLVVTDRPGNQSTSAEIPVRLREKRFIKSFEREPAIFSPNADGLLDDLEIRFELLQDARITLEVRDQDDALVARLLDAQLEAGVVERRERWDGHADLGGRAADGEYRLVLLAEDPETPPTLESESENLATVVDTVPPALEMSSPVEGGLAGLPLALAGGLAEIHPDRYTLALDSAANGRLELGSGSGAFASRQLAELDGQPDGDYAAIFTASDAAGNASTLLRRFQVDDTAPAVVILAPSTGEIRDTTGGYLALAGEITEDNLTGWAFSYAAGSAPEAGDFADIVRRTAPAGGRLEDGEVDFAWDASRLADGPYTLRLEATDALDRKVEARILLVVDNTPPLVEILAPQEGDVVGEPLDVLGSARDANLSTWRLELRRTSDGETQLLGEGVAEVDGDLLAAWNVLPLDGAYQLTLTADDRAGHVSDTTVTVGVTTEPPSPPLLLSAVVQNLRDVALAWQPGPGPTPEAYHLYRNGAWVGEAGQLAGLAYVDAGRPDGVYSYTLRAVAANGSETADSNALEVVVANGLPLARIASPADGARVADQVEVKGTAWREGGFRDWQLWVRQVAGAWQLIGSGTAPVLADFLATWDTALPQWPAGAYQLRLDVRDLYGHSASHAIAVEVDNTEPATPVLTVAEAAAQDPDAEVDDIHLEWTLDPLPADLAGFYLYRNGQLANAPGPVIGTTTPFLLPGPAFDDRNLPDGTYVYFVTAADTAGNESAASNSPPPIVIDTGRPHAVIVDPADGTEFEESVVLTAETPDLDVVSLRFEYRPVGGPDWILLATLAAPPWRAPFAPGAAGPYEVRAVAADGVGEDPAPEAIVITETDLPPSSPGSLSLRVDGGDIHLAWQAAADPHGDLAGYLIYRDGVKITATALPASHLSFVDGGLADGYYNYAVHAVDGGGNEGDSSPTRQGQVVTPTLFFTPPVVIESAIYLSADVPAYRDQVELYRRNSSGDDVLVATATDGSTGFDAVPLALGFNTFTVRGSSRAGDRTRRSPDFVLLRHPAPPAPAAFTAEVSGSDVTLDWSPVADPDVAGYVLARDGQLLGYDAVLVPYDSATHTLSANYGTPADWQRLVDGNLGTSWAPPADAYSNGLVFEWGWSTPRFLGELEVLSVNPASQLRVDVQVASGEWLWLYQGYSWSSSVRMPLGMEAKSLRFSVPRYHCNGCRFTELRLSAETRPAAPPLVDPGVANGALPYSIATLNRYGQLSNEVEALALIGETPPESPTGLVAEATGCAAVEVSWLPPANLPAIHLGYRLYRSAAAGSWRPLADLDTVTTSYYEDRLAVGTVYAYRVTTLAQIGGRTVESAPSNEGDALTSCATPPAPELLTPTVAGQPIPWPSQIADVGGRAWPGSTVTLYHDGAAIGTVALAAAGVDRSFDLPGFRSGLSVEGGRWAVYVGGESAPELIRLDLASGVSATAPAAQPAQPAVSPDGQRMVYVEEGAQTDLYLYDFATGTATRLTNDAPGESRPLFLPDGRSVLFLSHGPTDRLRRLDLASGAVSTLLESGSPELADYSLAADGSRAIIATPQGPWFFDLGSLSVSQPFWWTSPGFGPTAFSPSGTKAVFSMPAWNPQQGELYVADLATGGVEMASSQQGEFGASFLDEGALVFWQVAGGDTLRLVQRLLWTGEERVLLEGVPAAAVEAYGQTPVFREGDSAVWVQRGHQLLRLQQPSGQFVVNGVMLRPGSNFFTASQRFDGETQESEPIEVQVAPELFGDAAAVALDALPAFPVTGQRVVVQATYRNNGPAYLYDLVASLVRVTPAGASEAVAVENVYLPPGETRRLRYTFDTAGLEGDYLFRLELDPAQQLLESDEQNNRLSRTVKVRASLGFEARVATDRATYLVRDPVLVSGQLASSAPPAPTRVDLVVETAAGEAVATLATYELPSFGGGSQDFAARWETEDFVPGSYRARLVARQGGLVVAQAQAGFALEPRLALTVSASADRTFYVRGSTANLLARVRNVGDSTVQNAALHLIVEPMPSGSPAASQERRVAALAVGDQRSFSWAWIADAVPGAYGLRAVLVAADGRLLAEAEPYAFVIGPVGAELGGSLSVVAAATEPGGTLTVSAEARNSGDAAWTGGLLRVSIVDPKTGALLETLESPADFPAGAAVARSWPYTPAMRSLQPFVGILAAVDAGGAAQQLDTASFEIVDRTPPTLEWLGRDSFACSATLPLRVRALDTFSQVIAVDYRVDAGQLALPLVLESVEDTVWISYLYADPERTVPYRLTFHAADAAGNPATPLAVDYLPSIDEEAPVLTLAAPPDGLCVGGPASATFSAADANLVRLEAWLDGTPYLSGEPIAEGAHELRVLAEDGCGRITEEIRRFTVDSAPPVLTVAAPAEASCSAAPATITFSAADSNLATVSATLDGVPYLSGTPISADGPHLFVLEATDSCGNVSRETRSFVLDSAAPVLTVAAPGEASCTAAPATIVFSAADANLATVSATLDGAPYISGTPIAGDGPHVFVLEATDSCGNVSRETRSFILDSAPPALTLSAPEEASCSPPPAAIAFAASDSNLETVSATLDGVPYVSGTPITAEGPHLFVLEATDSCGNLSRETRSFTIDSAPPVLAITAPDAASCSLPPATVTFTATDGNLASATATLDGAPYVSGTPIAAEGPHHFALEAVDSCGNVSREERAFRLDAGPPTILLDAPAQGSCGAGPVFATWKLIDGNPHLATGELDGQLYNEGTPIGDGQHRLTVYGRDRCGNLAEESRDFLVDSLAPAIAFTGAEDGGIYDPPLTLTFAAADPNLTSVVALLDGTPAASPLVVSEPGPHLLAVRAADCAGNQREALLHFTVRGGEGTLLLTGSLDLPLRILHGESLPVMADLRNESSAGLEGATFAIRLVDQNDGTVLAEEALVMDLPAGGSSLLDYAFATAALEPRFYRVELRASGVYLGVPFDLELDRADVELLPVAIDVPTLDPLHLLLLSLLLAAAGFAALRRPSVSPRGSKMSETRLRRGRRPFLFLLLIGLGAAPGREAGAACEERFPELRRVLEANATGAPEGQGLAEPAALGLALKAAAPSLSRELEIEQALWRDEAERRRAELERFGADDAGRLAEREREMASAFEALAAALRSGEAPPAELAAALASCGDSESLSAEIAARGVELPHREPPPATAPPAGYLDRPDEALRQRLASRRAAAAERGELRAKSLADDELLALAASLDDDPVRIYRYVVEKVRPAYYFGAVRGPEATLRAGEGNDADQAALLAALLRAADFPARVAWGPVEIELADLLAHWNVRDRPELERAMTAAGVPWTPVAQAGQVRAYLVERAWCEVYIPYANFRGVVLDDSGSTWLGLDPSIKPRLGRADGSVLDQLGLDGEDFVAAYLEGASCTPPLERAGACRVPSALVEDEVDGLLGAGAWSARTAPPALPASAEATLPAGRVGVVRGVRGFAIDFPDQMRHRVRLRARAGSRLLLDATVAASDLAGREAALFFVPATDADRALAAAYGGLWLAPPYLVDAALQLWVDGEELALGSGKIGMGERFDLEIELRTPEGDSRSFKNGGLAGVPIGFGVAPGRSAYSSLAGEPGNTPQVLAALASAWLDSTADFAARLARLEGLPLVHPFPTFASVSSVVEPVGAAGLVERLDWRGIAIDADLFGARVVASPAAAARWLRLAGLEASAQERALFERYGMAAVSADLLVALARARGIAVHEVDGGNLGAILPTLPFGAAIRAEIEGWVRAGGRALVPAAEMDFVEFDGVGYVLQDGETGEARYQLSGRLSGGMIAVPPFAVVPGLASPLQVPQTDFVNTNGSDAVAIQLHDGNLQIAKVGKTLGVEAGTLPLRVLVRDRRGMLVSNAPVVFTVLAGGGKLAGGASATVRSIGGVATVQLELGQKTDKNPYYLLFPEERWAQRADLTIVKAEVNGYGMSSLFYEFGRPDEVTQLLTPFGSTVEGWPHVSVGKPVLVLPADRYANPVANQEVTFRLSASPPGAGKGPELLSVEQRANCAGTTQVLAGECGGTASVTDKGSITGVWSYLIVGEDNSYAVTATATTPTGEVSATITANVLKLVPTGNAVGWPTVLVAGRSQPVSLDGSESVEAYPPGKPSLPLKVSLLVVHEEFNVVGCSGRWCTQPTGKYKTRRLATTPMAGCFPAGCGGGQITESGRVQFSGEGISGTQTQPISAGVYQQAVTLPANPGRYPVRATPSVRVAVPRRPASPTFANEILPCNAQGCGALLELKDLSDPGWYIDFLLWAVRGKIDGTPPIVKLGHENRHETETPFPYLIEPADYKALGIGVAFIEDGTIPLLATDEGRGPGQAILPIGKIFVRPEGRHELQVMVNPGWVWQPGPGQPVSMMIEGEKVPFKVVQFDVDVDSDNTNGKNPPDRNDAEENIEEDGGPTGLGKLVFVNSDNDDADSGDDRPDYAQLGAVANEDNMVPVEIELRPEQGNYAGATLVFDYDGPPVGSLPDGTGASLGTKSGMPYYDYSGKKLGAYRLWRIAAQNAARSADVYLAPNTSYSASDLGFGSGSSKRTFWLEAINGKALNAELTPKDVKVRLSFGSESVEEKVRLTPVEPNLGFNNGNGSPAYMRPGVPDGLLWKIDGEDEKVEDQGNGFAFWIAADQNRIDEKSIEDTVPFIVDLPKRLIDDEWKFALQLVDPSRRVNIETYKIDPSMVTHLDHVSLEHRAEDLIDNHLAYHQMVSVDYIEREVRLTGEKSAFLMRVSPSGFQLPDGDGRSVRMNLLVRPKNGYEWISVDSVKLELKPLKKFISWWSGRNNPISRLITLPTECVTAANCAANPPVLAQQQALGFGAFEQIPGSAPVEAEVIPYFVTMHGYRVGYPDDALATASRVFRRMYWQGYRGNFVALTWFGNERDPQFSPNVSNAFRTSPNVQEFFNTVLQGNYGARPENITVMAHSLGNQVMFEAMRLQAIERRLAGKGLLFGTMVAVQAALWGETFWPQRPVDYSLPSVPITYSEEDLRWNSWTFWFNQRHHPAASAVNAVVHSWAPQDLALHGMKVDDCLVRNPAGQFGRPRGGPGLFRVPLKDGSGTDNDLATAKAAMLALRVPWSLGCTNFLVPPAGQAPNASTPFNVEAGQFGWGSTQHSAFQDYPVFKIYQWYSNTFRGRVPMGQDKF